MRPLQYAAAIVLVGAMIGTGAFGPVRGQAQGTLPATVQVPSADGTTTLTGFVYTPKDNRSELAPDRIGLQGWSNGGSAALAAMAVDAQRGADPIGFRAALVFYAACGLRRHFDAQGYRPYATVLAFHGTADEETSPRVCK